MTVKLNPTYFQRLLEATFTGIGAGTAAPGKIVGAALFGGVMPANPTLLDGAIPLASSAGQVVIPQSSWSAQSDGVVTLINPISFTPDADDVITFIRFYDDSTNPVLDLSLSTVPGSASGVVSVASTTNGVPVVVSDVRFKLGGNGISFNAAVLNYFLYNLTNSAALVPYPNNGLMAFSLINGDTGVQGADSVLIEAYSGVVPASADAPADGVLVWQHVLAVNEVFNVSGISMSLVAALSALGSVSDTPTYVRITKAAAGTMPETVMQGEVGTGVRLAPSDVISGVNATLTTLSFYLGAVEVIPG